MKIANLTLPVLVFLAVAQPSQAAGKFSVGISAGVSAVDGVTDTDPTPPFSTFSTQQLPEISLNGLPFDDEDWAGRIFVRYEFVPRFGVEVGYWNLGEFKSPDLLFQEPLNLEAEAFYARAQYSLPVSAKLSVRGSLGAAYASFDTSGRTNTVAFGSSPSPLVPFSGTPALVRPGLNTSVISPNVAVFGFQAIAFPLATPDSEVGVTWGIAVDWQLTDRWTLEFGYDQNRIRVQDVESLSIGISAGL